MYWNFDTIIRKHFHSKHADNKYEKTFIQEFETKLINLENVYLYRADILRQGIVIENLKLMFSLYFGDIIKYTHRVRRVFIVYWKVN